MIIGIMRKRLFIVSMVFVLVFATVSIVMKGNVTASNQIIKSGNDTIATMNDVREAFPSAMNFTKLLGGTYKVFGSGHKLLGKMLITLPYAKGIKGFVGPTPLLIALGSDGKVKDVILLKNQEHRAFVNRVKKHGLLSSWNGLSLNDAAGKDVDAVSGATYTSNAIIRSMRAAAKANSSSLASSTSVKTVKREDNDEQSTALKKVDEPLTNGNAPAEKKIVVPRKDLNQMIPSGLTLQQVKSAFSMATSFTQTATAYYNVIDASGKLIGYIALSSPYSDKIAGFGGPTPLMIALTTDYKIKSVSLLSNNETPDFVEHVKKSGLFSTWNGLSIKEALNKDVDAVSGATYTSTSVIKSFKARLAILAKEKVDNSISPAVWLKNILLIVVSLMAMLLYFRPKLIKRWRLPLLGISIVVLGFWQTTMLSIAQVISWLHHGVPLSMQWGLLVVVFLSIGLPMFFGKKFYCVYVCPLGALQDVAGQVNKRKVTLPNSVISVLFVVRKAIFLAVVLVVLLGVNFDIGIYEPFSAFDVLSAPIVALIIAIVSVVLSLFIQKPWCRFVCPLGQGLDLFVKMRHK